MIALNIIKEKSVKALVQKTNALDTEIEKVLIALASTPKELIEKKRQELIELRIERNKTVGEFQERLKSVLEKLPEFAELPAKLELALCAKLFALHSASSPALMQHVGVQPQANRLDSRKSELLLYSCHTVFLA
ncbi:MAG: hypothetical protein HC848_08210 [Limnobacter sp.]|nr:hypothetical protein [Limnobacter sp.]